MTFKYNPGQQRALDELLTKGKRYNLLYGGSRSGKSALLVSCDQDRALFAPGSRHLIVRKEMTAAKVSIARDTFPKMWALRYPGIPSPEWKDQDAVFIFPNGSEVWLGGLNDDKAVEKMLGREYATIHGEEISEWPYHWFTLLRSRLAQVVNTIEGEPLSQRFYGSLNPTTRMHWTYRLWIEGIDPQDEVEIDRTQFGHFVINPYDNRENLTGDYLADLESLPERQKKRFLLGEYVSDDENALWRRSYFRRSVLREDGSWPVQMKRIVVAVDPAVSSAPGSDETGIVCMGVGVDGFGYLLADESGRYRPEEWARRAVSLYRTMNADRIVAEVNNGGDLVESQLRAVDGNVPVKKVHATRGKAVRAEPVAALYERGKVMHIGKFPELEDQCCFPAGTPVETIAGIKPIEAVRAGDLVLTRNGFAPVKIACDTGMCSEFVLIKTECGRVLRCTETHPIFTASRGFVSARNVRPGDRLIDARSVVSSGCPLLGAGDGITAWRAGIIGTQKVPCFTGPYGKLTTALFLMGSTFITGMRTLATTVWQIWSALTLSPIMPNTCRAAGMAAANTAEQQRQSVVLSGQAGLPLNMRASSAAASFIQGTQSRAFVLRLADKEIDLPAKSGTLNARLAEPNSAPATLDANIVVASVTTLHTTPESVFNLEVADGFLPEYFANGALVHNCALTLDFDRKAMGWSPDRVDALVWAATELFPSLSARKQSEAPKAPQISMV